MMKAVMCSVCQSPIPEMAPEGGCPQCLARLALRSVHRPRFGRFTPPAALKLATCFEGLEVLSLLGSGGMGAVYLARQTRLDRPVALKILPPELADDPLFAERFLREAQALARLNHPFIVRVYDTGQAGPYLFILMEYVEGASLRDLIGQGKLDPVEAMHFIPQLCEALQYAHERGVIHRDIKPENVLVDLEGKIKITDFGLAKLALGSDPGPSHLTDAHTRMGTQGYMAPEQMANSSTVDGRADIYSLGILFYEMLTGCLPSPDYRPPSHLSDVDPAIDRVVVRTIKHSPDERYQEAAEVQRDVERIAGHGAGRAWFLISNQLPRSVLWAVPLLAGVVALATWLTFAQKGPPLPEPPAASAPFTAEQAQAHQQSWARYLGVPVEFTNSLGMHLRLIPPGRFLMGASELEPGRSGDNERPQHEVAITRPFYLAIWEVRTQDFEAFVEETGYQTEAEKDGQGCWPFDAEARIWSDQRDPACTWRTAGPTRGALHPVTTVSWNDAIAFCRWLSAKEGRTYELPTEAEWEYACRAGTATHFSSGDDKATLEGQANLADQDLRAALDPERARWEFVPWRDGHAFTAPVGTFAPNAWGLHDLHGNVWEWCRDRFDEDYYKKSPDQDPRGPAESATRVFRGGGYRDVMRCRSAARSHQAPDFRHHDAGFRVVLRSLPQP
ncbi:MAG: bifunctional serine/threonine-protein kinase/formylglycine-generating enzyme family protein [Gemmataceae bacterium]